MGGYGGGGGSRHHGLRERSARVSGHPERAATVRNAVHFPLATRKRWEHQDERGLGEAGSRDFSVSEIGENGSVVELHSKEPPPSEVEPTQEELRQEWLKQVEEGHLRSGMQALSKFLRQGDVEHVESLLRRVRETAEAEREFPSENAQVLVGAGLAKEERTRLHQEVRELFGAALETETDENAGDKPLKVRARPPGAPRRSERWPKTLPPHLHFTLHKANRDTQGAIADLARNIGSTQRQFGYAGTKDKRAVTTQRVSVHRQLAGRVAAAGERVRGVEVGDFERSNDALGLGELAGNRFRILLRHVREGGAGDAERAAKALEISGCINYYGLQRFGRADEARSHDLGRELLKGNWKEAVEMLMTPRKEEGGPGAKAREIFGRTGDAKAALKKVPAYLTAERAVLTSLAKRPGNYQQALVQIPKPTRMLYVHAYQSLLFNLAASARVREHGLASAVEGDIVLGPDGTPRHVSASESLPIDDVVLPVPGNSTILPENCAKDAMLERASADGVSIPPARSPHRVKEFSMECLRGAYRHLLLRPSSLRYELLSMPPDAPESNDNDPAISLEFDLPPSAYATMIIRELTKSSSSVASHRAATLNIDDLHHHQRSSEITE